MAFPYVVLSDLIDPDPLKQVSARFKGKMLGWRLTDNIPFFIFVLCVPNVFEIRILECDRGWSNVNTTLVLSLKLDLQGSLSCSAFVGSDFPSSLRLSREVSTSSNFFSSRDLELRCECVEAWLIVVTARGRSGLSERLYWGELGGERVDIFASRR